MEKEGNTTDCKKFKQQTPTNPEKNDDSTHNGKSSTLWGCLGMLVIATGIICYKSKKTHNKKDESPKAQFTSKDCSRQERVLKTQPKKKRHSNITPELVNEWKSLAKEGVSRSEIAEKFNVSVNTVNNHLKVKTYKRAKKHE